MLIHQYLVIMNYNLLCNRIMCHLKLTFCNTSRTLWTKHRTKNVPQKFSYLFWNCHKDMHLSSLKSSEVSVEESGEVEDVALPLPKSLILEDFSEQFRNTLYPNSEDPIISQLKSCGSIKTLFTIIGENIHSMNHSRYCQVLLVLYDILHINNCLALGTSLTILPKSIENELPKPLSSVVLNILELLVKDIEKLNPEELACCLLYAKRLGVDIRNPTVECFLLKVDNLLSEQNAESFSISALSRLTLTFYHHSELWSKLYLIKTLPLIYAHFEKCHSVDEFRALTISMLSTLPYLREEILIEYEALTEEFIRKGLITREHPSAIVKAAMLFNQIYHIPAARYMSYKLLNMLQGSLDQMFLHHLLEIQRVVSYQIEPRDILVELHDLKKTKSHLPDIGIETFSTYISLMYLPADAKKSQVMKVLISRSDSLDMLLSAEPHLTTALPDICQLFWSRAAELLQLTSLGDLSTLIRVCIRYMLFSYRMATYHHRQFESVALSLLARELVAGMTVMPPRQLARIASFVLAMDTKHGAASLSSNVVSQLLPVMPQLDSQSCLWLSRGLGDRLKKNKDMNMLMQLDSAMNERTRELLKTEDLSSIKLFNSTFRSCINRKQSMESVLVQDVIKRWESLDWSQLTSRSLRNLVYNLHITSALVPAVVDRLVGYCLANSGHVSADTVGKLLHMCYDLGHAPRHIDSLCGLAADLATRDYEILNGLGLLQVCLALSFFNHLPRSLVRIIFTVDFLETLDTEIKHCFAKDRYPLRVRQTLMELNRSVCLDQPEADVPWFHSKFCEEQKALGQLEVVPTSLLFTDVYNTLLKLVGDSQYIGTKAFTPYGYALDMQLNLDPTLRPVRFKNPENVAHKLALLLYYRDSFTHMEQKLKGYYQMKQRHLEILGYRVIGLSDSLWNAMYMAEPKVKLEYLQNLIWPS